MNDDLIALLLAVLTAQAVVAAFRVVVLMVNSARLSEANRHLAKITISLADLAAASWANSQQEVLTERDVDTWRPAVPGQEMDGEAESTSGRSGVRSTA